MPRCPFSPTSYAVGGLSDCSLQCWQLPAKTSHGFVGGGSYSAIMRATQGSLSNPDEGMRSSTGSGSGSGADAGTINEPPALVSTLPATAAGALSTETTDTGRGRSPNGRCQHSTTPATAAASVPALGSGAVAGATSRSLEQSSSSNAAAASSTVNTARLPGSRGLQAKTASQLYEKDGAPVGVGAYGEVWRAKRIQDGKPVALKKVVLPSEREGFPVTTVREIRTLRMLDHPNIVKLLDVVADPPDEGNIKGSVYLVFEYEPNDLTGLLAFRKHKLKKEEVKCLTKQLFNSLDFCHLRGIMHRDLKPSNILVSSMGRLRLCDFGLSKPFKKKLNGSTVDSYTARVITLWYRPPELLLCGQAMAEYDQSVDVWSAGCIFAELFTGKPLFSESSELQVFHKICKRCGLPSKDEWPAMRELANWPKMDPGNPDAAPAKPLRPGEFGHLTELREKHGDKAVDLLQAMVALNPAKRVTMTQAYHHAYFEEEPRACKEEQIKIPRHLHMHELDVKRNLQQQKDGKQNPQVDKRPRTPGGAMPGHPGADSPKRRRPAP